MLTQVYNVINTKVPCFNKILCVQSGEVVQSNGK